MLEQQPLTILAIVGSLRKDSFNRQLAEAARDALGDRAKLQILNFAEVPLFNQDTEYPAPEAVSRARTAVREADGLWFFTPEYNHSFPGVLKNLIDWLSRPASETERQVLYGKPAALAGISGGMSGTLVAQDQLAMLLSYLNLRLMNVPRVAVPNARSLADEQGRLTLPDKNRAFLQKEADAFVAFLRP